MTRPQDACPRCSSRRIVLGEITRGITIGSAGSFSFRAFASRLSWMRKGTAVPQNMAACVHCGLIWGQVSVNNLLQHLETLPGKELAAWLTSRNDTPI